MSGSSIKKTFDQVNSGPKTRSKTKPKVPPPFSLRLSWDERKQLEREAGRMSLSAHTRSKLFGDSDTAVGPRKRSTRKSHQPTTNHVLLAQLLGTFGQSELGRSMLALSVAAQCGALPVDEELTDKLHSACDNISEMRQMLVVALGIKPQSGDHS